MRRLIWIGLGFCCALVVANVIEAVAVHGAWWLLIPATGLIAPFTVVGFVFGRWLLWKDLERAYATVTCIGGPMDGTKLPAPPPSDALVMHVEEHPEGSYRLDGDRLIWEEE